MKILLINPPLFKDANNVWKYIDSCTPPFGLIILASIILEQGIDVEIVDFNALKIPVSMVINNFPNDNYDIIGITATTALFANALDIADVCKQLYPQAKIVMGGVHPTILPSEALDRDSVDFVIRGEGEESFLKLIKGYSSESIPGLSFRINGQYIHNPRPDKLVELNDLPMPAYHLIPMELYHTALGSSLRSPNIGMISSRGCPGKCTYCYGNILGKKIRFKSPWNIYSEIKYLQDNYGIREIAFYDDTFTTSKKNVQEFCRLIIDNDLDLTWSCFSRVDTVDYDTLKLMKQSGCHQISVGIESGDEQILKNIQKHINLEQAEIMVKNCREIGIVIRACFMLGNPGETAQTLKKTIEYSKKLDPDIALYNITTPFPGSKMYDWAKENGYLLTEDWRKYDLAQVVMELPTIDSKDLLDAYKKAYRGFYLRPSYILKRLFKMRTMHDLRSNWNALMAIIKLD